MADLATLQLAQMIYGENASEDYDTMVMTGSSALNRLEAERPQEFGATLPEVLQKGYYAVSKNSPMYQQAVSGQFPDEKSEQKFKQALQISYGLQKGTIERREGEFFFKKGEAKGLRKKLNFIEKVGQYDVYGYEKPKSSVPFKEAFKSAREQGLDVFEWSGKKYNTKLKSQE